MMSLKWSAGRRAELEIAGARIGVFSVQTGGGRLISGKIQRNNPRRRLAEVVLVFVFLVWGHPAAFAQTGAPSGVDYGLKRQCIRTTSPNEVNFFYDDVDCPGPSYPTSGYWTTAVETDSSLENACVGALDQSFLINGPTGTSPVTETWTGDPSTGYSVELRTDFSSVANPCSPQSWTWVPLMDNWVGGGPLPSPASLQSQFNATFSRILPASSGATRAFAGFAGQWNVQGSAGSAVLNSVQVEINLYTDEPQWGRQSGLPPDVIHTVTAGNPPFDFVNLDGSKLIPPLSISPSEETLITVNWVAILQHIIDEGLFQPPINGWSDSSAATTATDAGTEVDNTATGLGGPTADLIVSSYKESSIDITVAPAPLLSSLEPSSVSAGGVAFSLNITGSGFAEGATAYWTQNGQTMALATEFVSPTSLSASIPADFLASSGTALIDVANPYGYANLNSTLGLTIETPPGGTLAVSPHAVKFPMVDIGVSTPARKSLTINNKSKSQTLSVAVGALSAPFSLSNPGTFTLNPGQRLTPAEQITFAPTATGTFRATLTITSGDPSHRSVNLKVEGRSRGRQTQRAQELLNAQDHDGLN
jgi:hypothetical protein